MELTCRFYLLFLLWQANSSCFCFIRSMPVSPVTARLFSDIAFVRLQWKRLMECIPNTIGLEPVKEDYGLLPVSQDLEGAPNTASQPVTNNNVIFTNFNSSLTTDINDEWKALLYAVHASE